MLKKYIKIKPIVTTLFLVATLLFSQALNAQPKGKDYKLACVGFYNLENLFDTIDEDGVRDTEFTPTGEKKWTSIKYQKKLGQMSKVISQIGDEYIKGGPYLLGVSEIENKTVLEDLIKMPALEKSNYGIVHYNSPDRRGIDVGLLYRKDFFKVTHSRSVHFTVPDEINPYDDEFRSRDQLCVSGLLNGDPIHIIVNHWPSRRGGEKRSAPLRNAAADVTRSIIDSIRQDDKNAKIIVMGDLNDDPTNNSVTKHLHAKGKKKKLKEGDLYNPMVQKYKKGNGTTAYRDAWSLFDQLMLSQSLLGKDYSTYKLWKTKICKKKFLITKKGKYKGYPKRTFNFDKFQNGYSDHFPVYLFLIKEK